MVLVIMSTKGGMNTTCGTRKPAALCTTAVPRHSDRREDALVGTYVTINSYSQGLS